MCRNQDRRDKLAYFELYLEWKKEGARLQDSRPDTVAGTLPPSQAPVNKRRQCTKAQCRPLRIREALLTKPIHDAFNDNPSYTPRNDSTAFILTSRITVHDVSIATVSRTYNLPNLLSSIKAFYNPQLSVRDTLLSDLPFHLIDCWDRVRLQVRSVYDDSVSEPPETVMASPPSSSHEFGNCNCVLIDSTAFQSFPSVHSAPRTSRSVTLYPTLYSPVQRNLPHSRNRNVPSMLCCPALDR